MLGTETINIDGRVAERKDNVVKGLFVEDLDITYINNCYTGYIQLDAEVVGVKGHGKTVKVTYKFSENGNDFEHTISGYKDEIGNYKDKIGTKETVMDRVRILDIDVLVKGIPKVLVEMFVGGQGKSFWVERERLVMVGTQGKGFVYSKAFLDTEKGKEHFNVLSTQTERRNGVTYPEPVWDYNGRKFIK